MTVSLIRRAALAAVLALGAPAAQAGMQDWQLDPKHTTLGFLVEHIGYARVFGLFREVEGSFRYDPETQALADVRVVVPAGSVWTNDERRDGHVRNKDFLDAEAHPEIVFTAAGGTVTGENSGRVEGELSLRGQSHPLALEVTLNKIGPYPFGHGKPTIGVSARGTVVRSAYGMTYALGGIVGDEVELLIEFEAVLAE
ncbi:YceI family protein [Paralimibaculum aggregatum]|uniref:YceI family protein n=1 Tax=Paralimibaculum aggregatum TaxID=3036245 RepID=A0ABQ6LNS7_9RHOB|nr:YceI family protein [Limibaculum sp. NKW23]GMG82274.1 YceI family protein [Limibaculum sp. NKW23]